nr:integrase, catalytic region, zinc finger, CCHC-type, peptidase aspartic, catalytic [Tanacetum cinerariifolium]
MNAKMNDPECVTRKVKIAPHDYLKENFLATFTPQKQLTLEQIFWSNDLMKLKSKALKEQTKTVPRTPQQNGVVERRNRTFVKAARTMLIFSKAPMFLWAKAVATAVFGALCYPTNDSEDLRKLQPTADTSIFIISGLVPNPVLATPYALPTNKYLEILFQPMFDEYLEPPHAERPVPPAQAVQAPANSAGTPSSTTIDQDTPSPSISPLSSALQSHSLHQGIAVEPNYIEDHTVAPVDNTPFVNIFAPKPHSEASTSGDLSSTESPYVSQTLHHLNKWIKDHPLDNVIGNLSRPVSTRKQLATNAFWCSYSSVLSKVEPKNFKYAITEDCWFQAMQDEIHEFDILCNTPKLDRSGIWIRGVLLHRSITQNIYRTTKNSFKTDTLDLIKVFDTDSPKL